jgi:hypothetical protein
MTTTTTTSMPANQHITVNVNLNKKKKDSENNPFTESFYNVALAVAQIYIAKQEPTLYVGTALVGCGIKLLTHYFSSSSTSTLSDEEEKSHAFGNPSMMEMATGIGSKFAGLYVADATKYFLKTESGAPISCMHLYVMWEAFNTGADLTRRLIRTLS